MENKVVFLVGNGFNMYASSYLKSEELKIEIIEKWKKTAKGRNLDDAQYLEHIAKTSRQLEEYCKILDGINIEESGTTGENLLFKIGKFLSEKKVDDSMLNGLFRELEESIASEIKTKFSESAIQNSGKSFMDYIHATVKFSFTDYSDDKDDKTFFAQKLSKIVKDYSKEKCNVYTTNYDDIVRSVFTEMRGVEEVDGLKCIHLHGHYKEAEDKEGQGKIICCSPTKKRSKIQEEVDNEKNFNGFKADLANLETLVLFGIGLVSDPHILEEINKLTERRIIIIDYDKSRYFNDYLYNANKQNNVTFDFLTNNSIYFIDTNTPFFKDGKYERKMITPEDILSELEGILTSN